MSVENRPESEGDGYERQVRHLTDIADALQRSRVDPRPVLPHVQNIIEATEKMRDTARQNGLNRNAIHQAVTDGIKRVLNDG
jgi:DNA-binding phage protein